MTTILDLSTRQQSRGRIHAADQMAVLGERIVVFCSRREGFNRAIRRVLNRL
jgi:hypothetical protein